MISPEGSDAEFTWKAYGGWSGIASAAGTALVSPDGALQLRTSKGKLLTTSRPLKADGTPLQFSTRAREVYGHGASREDAFSLTSNCSTPIVCNTGTLVPYYYSAEGYAALAVANGSPDRSYYAASYNISPDGKLITWGYRGHLELYLLPAETLAESTKMYFGLIGRPSVPPRYTFGFMASRWGWEDKAYIEDTLLRFRQGGYPLDAIILDFEWFVNETDYSYSQAGKPYYMDFGWNSALWPSPQDQLSRYRRDFNVRVGGLRKPRIGNSNLLSTLGPQGFFLKTGEPSGSWPPNFDEAYAKGRCLDFTQEVVRKWYSKTQGHYLDQGVEFWWNDEGETSYFTYYWWCKAEIETLRSKSLTKRYFSLNRAWTPGMARLGAAAWTGDIDPTWKDMRTQPGMMLNWAVGGQPYVANDIGGFTSNSTPHLLARWMQMGALLPLMRTHSTCSPWATPHWPWLWGDQTARAIKLALELRYRLLPYHYSLAHRMYATGELWMRPLVMEFPNDPVVKAITEQWMDGAILVAPVLNEDSTRKVYIPKGSWYSLRASNMTQAPLHCKACSRTLYNPLGSGHRSVDLIEGPVYMGGKAAFEELPAFVRAGTVLPLAPVVQHSDALPGGPLEVQVYSGADGAVELVEDDGETLGYEDGKVRITYFTWNDKLKTLSWSVRSSPSAVGDQTFREVFVRMFYGRTGFSTSGTGPLGAGGSIRMPEGDSSLGMQQAHHI